MKLPQEFYLESDVVKIAQNLLGKVLVTYKNNVLSSGIICETEAYRGINDKASHAYNNKITQRIKIMYKKGGIAYVYLCYGIHHLFNVVTNIEGIPDAVLIRGIIPLEGLEVMAKRTNKSFDKLNGRGPANVSKLLAITTMDTGKSLLGNEMWIEDRGITIPKENISKGKRIGVSYAQEDADLLYRFWINGKEIMREYIKNRVIKFYYL